MTESLSGRLLLASPALSDPNFARAVVLVGVHDEEGAMGLVLNRPATVKVAEAAPALAGAAGQEEPLFVGGPVSPTALVCLVEFLDPERAGLLLVDRIGFPAPDAQVEALERDSGRVRVFAGYAGWGAGQLDSELGRGDWIVEEALPQDVFAEDPDGLWSAVLARKGGGYAALARMPQDPSVN